MNVMHVCANPRPISESTSKQMAASFFAKLAELNPDVNVTNVDLYQSRPPVVSGAALMCWWNSGLSENYQPTPAEQKATNYARQQCALLKDTDILVLTMPVWNNSMPAIMKAWIDQVMIPNQMFMVGADGTLQPLHHIRRVILLISSAEVFKENDPADGLTPAIRATFNAIGISDIVVAWADGQDKDRRSDAGLRKEMAMEAAQELAEETAEMAVQTP